MRFINNCRSKRNEGNSKCLSVKEINDVTLQWIQTSQEEEFQDIFQFYKRKSIIKPTIVWQLNVNLDKRDILRCKARIQNVPVNEETKIPILMPSSHKLTTLIIMDAHTHQMHGGVINTVTQLRQKYWIPRIRQGVKSCFTEMCYLSESVRACLPTTRITSSS